MLNIIFAVVGRDLKLAMRRQADIVSALFFFIIVVSLFPLGIGPEPDLAAQAGPGVLWVAACSPPCCRCRACSPTTIVTARSSNWPWRLTRSA
jgi:hypothetical protein